MLLGRESLSQAMRKLIGSRNASWCALATHPSKTAGKALRHELMPGALKSLMVRRAAFENTFFRCYQQYKRMFAAPFVENQVAAIDAGHLPAGRL